MGQCTTRARAGASTREKGNRAKLLPVLRVRLRSHGRLGAISKARWPARGAECECISERILSIEAVARVFGSADKQVAVDLKQHLPPARISGRLLCAADIISARRDRAVLQGTAKAARFSSTKCRR
jgi:hypothetical protein